MFLLAMILIAYSATSLRRVVIQQAEQQAITTGRAQAATITTQFNQALETTHTVGQMFVGIKNHERPLTLSRDGANTILTQILTSNPQYVDIWSLWEPNAFDGKDANFGGKPPYDQTGRYNVYMSRSAHESLASFLARQ